MTFLSIRLIARLMWALPVLLLVIAAATAYAGFEQRAVYERGETVTADVLGLNLRERSEVTHGAVRLRYTMPGDAQPTYRTAEMPLVLIKEIEAGLNATPAGQTYQVPLLVSPNTDQVVLGEHPRGQWLLTFSFAGMALIGAVVSGLLVNGWNRLLAREGDPATRLSASV